MSKFYKVRSLKLVMLLSMLFTFVGVTLNLPEVKATEGEEAQPTYVIGTDTTFAPFEFVDSEGNMVGIDMDILNAIAEDQGFDYELKVLGFNAAIQAVESGQVDGMIAGMGITEEREQSFDFSDPYFNAGVVFASREDNEEINSLEDLQGKTIAAKTGTAGYTVATELSEQYDFDVTVFEDSANMYEDVMVGNSDAAVEDYPVMAYAINNGGLGLKVISEDLEAVDYGFAVKNGENAELVEMFNAGLTNIQASGEYDEILSRYIGEDAQESNNASSFIGQILQNWQPLLSGLWSTIWISLISIAIAVVLGVIVGLMRTGDNAIVSGIASLYIALMRGIPIIVLAFFIYFGIPQMTGISFPATIAGIATLGLNASAYIAEIVRGGINAIPVGQTEASKSLGLNSKITMNKVVLPQAIRVMIPSIINQFVITLKDSSILSVIGLVELTQTGKIIIARTYQSGSMWLIVGIMYLIIITILTKTSDWLERKYVKN